MGDYISRDMAIARLTKVEVTNRQATMTDAKREIAEMPAADVAPVVHGRWQTKGYVCGETEYQCTACGETEWRTSIARFRWCPFCGAKMDGGIKTDG